MLTLKDVYAGYGKTTVVHGVSAQVDPQRSLAVLGFNGAGKTTLLRSIVGLLKPMKGTIEFDGTDITSMPAHKRIRMGMAYVAQGQQSFGELTAHENLKLLADDYRDGAKRIDDALDLFPALKEVLNRRAGLLSGGQRQQLAIARALLSKPTLLLLDEPTEGIQPSVVQHIERNISDLVESGLTVVLVEQHVGFAVQACDDYLIMMSGRAAARGTGGAQALDDVREAMVI